jgi:hypothetical protein
MSKIQLQSELPLAYARAKQRLAVPIYTAKDATEKYLASQILMGFTTFWKKALFIRFQDTKEKVYESVDELVRDVRRFYDLHLQSGGVPNEPSGNTNSGYQGNQGYSGGKQSSMSMGGNTTVSGQKRGFTHSPDKPSRLLTRSEFDGLPPHVLKGGSAMNRGQTANCVCVLCFRMGHTFEFCASHNGYNKKNGQPIEGYPRGYVPQFKGYGYRSQQAIPQPPPVKRLTQ